ncbi:uncharacterized protein ofcc1 [Chanos chanos]|uniref:Uncharacterized protein ofcc1 n=1 Tax=Chanos chanos TaxID=29144 RepID=A0A6J2UUY3_CHACN|nr:uncharacterized protein LOC115806395 [Chanos chanos]
MACLCRLGVAWLCGLGVACLYGLGVAWLCGLGVAHRLPCSDSAYFLFVSAADGRPGTGSGSGSGWGSAARRGPAERTRLMVRVMRSELGLSGPRCWPRLCLITALLSLIWFPRLYLHYCSQWLCLQALSVPVNKLEFHAHTVELVYQGSLLSAWEEMAVMLLGPLTLNAVLLVLFLIRSVCQTAFGSHFSVLSKFIMAVGVWTVLHPPALFAVDAVLGRLSYSADKPVADAAKLYWHFYRTDQSGAAGIIITLFLYTVLLVLSVTMLQIHFIRFHNDGQMLDVYQRLRSTEGAFFVPHDLELSNQELSYIVKKAEQWRGFNGERRKVAVYDYIWTEEEPPGGQERPGGAAAVVGETSTHVSIYTLHLSGLRECYRHFLRQPDGAIIEVIGDMDCAELHLNMSAKQKEGEEEEERMKSRTDLLRERRRRQPAWRSNRVEPLGGNDQNSSAALTDLLHQP